MFLMLLLLILLFDPAVVKTLLANGFTTFFIMDKPVISNGPKSLPKNDLGCLFYAVEFLIILN